MEVGELKSWKVERVLFVLQCCCDDCFASRCDERGFLSCAFSDACLGPARDQNEVVLLLFVVLCSTFSCCE
jgi:hypothetical protein